MELATIPYSIQIAHHGRNYDVKIPALTVPRCTNCAAISIDDGADHQISEAFYREAKLLTPDQIQEGRKRLELTQKQFAYLLDVGESTVCRWERGGQIQERSNDSLMRLVFDEPKLLRKLAEQRAGDPERQDLEQEVNEYFRLREPKRIRGGRRIISSLPPQTEEQKPAAFPPGRIIKQPPTGEKL